MPGRARTRVVAAVVEACTARLPYKAAALFFAVVLWVVASADEPAARYVDVRLAPALDRDVRLLGAPPRVRALVVGPARELMKLYGSPPVLRRAIGDAPPDSLRVELRPGDVDLPSGVASVVVRDVRPRAVTLRFETLAARRVPVRVAVRAADGALPPESDFVVEPETVLVRGPRRVVLGLASLATMPRIVGPGESLGEVALDTAALGVHATPPRVRLLLRTRAAPATTGAPPAADSAPPATDSAPAPPRPARPP